MQDAVNQLRDLLPLEEAEALRKLGIIVRDGDNDDSGTVLVTSRTERLAIPKPSPSQLGRE